MNPFYRFALFVASVVFFFTISLSQWLPAEAAGSPPKREFRGAWVATVGNIDWPSPRGIPVQTQKDQLVSILDRLDRTGINAVIFQIRPECDALYQSAIEPWSYWLTGSQGSAPSPLYDPLQFAVEESHKRGMEIHAWFNPYRAVHQAFNYAKAATHVTVQHPDWILTIGALKMLDPGKEVVRNYVSGVIADVVRRYDVDAAHMDDYFYGEGITNQDAATFTAESRGFVNLGDWRRDNVNLLIKQIHDSVRTIKPWVKFGMSPRGIWKSGVPPGTTGSNNYDVIYCDAIAWLQGRYIDYIAPQLYWKFGGLQNYGLLQPWWADSARAYGRHLYPGLALYKIDNPAYDFGPAGEIAHQIRFNRTTQNTQGSMLYTTNNLTGNAGGITDSLQTDLYRFPSLLPTMGWKDSVIPNAPPSLRYELLASGGLPGLRWDLPPVASDGDTASRYVVYRFNHVPGLPGELSDPANILAVAGSRSNVPKTPSGSGPFYFAVTALDRNYNESGTSGVLTVSSPPPPVLAAPSNGAPDQPPSVALSWFAPALASSYRLQVATDPSLASGLLVNDSTLADTSRIVTGMKGQQTYYWRVGAGNAGGWSAYSNSRTFTTGFPATPFLAAPVNFVTRAATDMYFRWHPTPGAVSYRFQISTSFDFAATIVDTSNLKDTAFTVNGLQVSKTHFWRIKATNAVGASEWSEIWRFITDSVATSIATGPERPALYDLAQNYPNPFNPLTTITYRTPLEARVSLRVYNLLGEEVRVLVDDVVPAGDHQLVFDGSSLSSGIYFYRLIVGGYAETRKMQLVK